MFIRGFLPRAVQMGVGRDRGSVARFVDRLAGGEVGGAALMAALVGCTVAAASWLLLLAYSETAALVFGSADVAASAGRTPWLARLLVPAAGGLACGLLVRFLGRGAFGQDVPELIEDVGRRGGRVDLRRAVVKAVASVATLGSGGSAGPEGPVVHVGGAAACAAGRVLGADAQRLKVLVACGCAAGISAVFGAPLAGVLFAVEVILGAVHMRTLVPVAAASVAAAATRQGLLAAGLPAGLFIQFPVPAGPFTAWDVLLCAVLGMLAGVVGAAFSRGVNLLGEVFAALPLPPWLLPAAGGLVVGAMGLVLPEVYGSGYGVLAALCPVDPAPAAVAVAACLVVWKFLATSITIGSGGAGGIFAPSLVMGGALGAAFAAFLQAVAGTGAGASSQVPAAAVGGSPALFVFAGAVAVLAATTHGTLMAVALVFEITLDSSLLLPSLLAATAALVVSALLSRETVHTLALRRYGKRARGPAGEGSVLQETPVSSLVRADAERVSPGEPLSRLVRRVVEGAALSQHVVDEHGKLLGTVSLHEVGPLLREDGVEGLLLAYDVMRAPPLSVTRSDSLGTCLERFARVDADELPVVDGAGALVGKVTRKDVLAFYAREVLADRSLGMKIVSRRDRAGATMGEGDETTSEVLAGFVEVPQGHTVRAVTVPPGFVGRSLKDLDLRSRFGVSVISMRRRTPGGGRISMVGPDPNAPLKEGDVLVLTGPNEQVRRLLALVGIPDEEGASSEGTG